ncbi:MAG: DUF2179 domain-containing protein [Caldilineaceae bacterium]
MSHWEIKGGHTGEVRTMVLCTIYCPVSTTQRIVGEVDPAAFVAIGMTQQALGEGFTDLRRLFARLERTFDQRHSRCTML